MRPSVSVVIPSYNHGHYVTEAVESTLQQTLPPLEVIVVDDGSTDDTRSRLAPYAGQVRCVRQENRGLSAARNAGIREAKGQWIAFLDADDRWHPRKLEVQLRAVSEMPDVVFFGSPPADDLQADLAPHPRMRRLTVRDFLGWMPLSGSSAVVQAFCFDEVGSFDEELRSVEDRDMWLRLAAAFPSAAVDAGCWWYRQHPGQMNRNPKRMHENFTRVLERFFARHPEYHSYERFAWAYLYMDSGYSHFAAGDRKTGLGFLLRSLWLYPWALSDDPRRRLVRVKILSRLLLGEKLWRLWPGPARRRRG